MKFISSPLSLFLLFVVQSVSCEDCSNVVSYNTWSNSIGFHVEIPVKEAIDSWDVVITFSSKVEEMSDWGSANSEKVDDQTYKFSNREYNRLIFENGKVNFDAQATLSELQEPIITSVELNGENQCNGAEGSTTNNPITTENTTPTSEETKFSEATTTTTRRTTTTNKPTMKPTTTEAMPTERPSGEEMNGFITLHDDGFGTQQACGFPKPPTSTVSGFFTATSIDEQYKKGRMCGVCYRLVNNNLRGAEAIVMNGDSCGRCKKGDYDVSTGAWNQLTDSAAPDIFHNISSMEVPCPDAYTGGNMEIFVKEGSHQWDMRLMPFRFRNRIKAMQLSEDGGQTWQDMHPPGTTSNDFFFKNPKPIKDPNNFDLKIISENGKEIVTHVSKLEGGSFIPTNEQN